MRVGGFVARFAFLSFALVLIAVSARAPEVVEAGSDCPSPASTALRVYAPVTNDWKPAAELDPSLLEHLQVRICKLRSNGECPGGKTFRGWKRRSRIRAVDGVYEIDWKPPKGTVEIHFSVADLPLGFVAYRAGVREPTVIRFGIENHPAIRAAVQFREGAQATDVARMLGLEFGIGDSECIAEILKNEGRSCGEIGEVLYRREEVAARSARILSDLECPEREICRDVLESIYGLGADESSELSCTALGFACAAKEIPPLEDALDVLKPLDKRRKKLSGFDASLTDFLMVSVCLRTAPDECSPIVAFTSAPSEFRDAIRLRKKSYQVDWHVDPDLVGRLTEVRILVAGRLLSAVPYVPTAAKRIKLKFKVELHPLIRAIVASAEEMPVLDIAGSLVEEFDLSATELAWVLNEAGYDTADVHTALTQVAGMEDVFQIEGVFEAVCTEARDYLELTAWGAVERFAPVLGFDQDQAVSRSGAPMSADEYFREMLNPDDPILTPAAPGQDATISWRSHFEYREPGDAWFPCTHGQWIPGRDEWECGMENPAIEQAGPTYVRVINDRRARDEGRLRIAYWWFYGWQPACNTPGVGDDGAHHGDWEHIVVTTSPDRSRVDAVTFYFHGVTYTRQNFNDVEGRPYVYVGKFGHGSYHSNQSPSCWMQGTPHHCCHYADCRNPDPDDVEWSKWSTQGDLVSLHGDAESWMAHDRTGEAFEYAGESYTIDFWRWGPQHDFCHFWFFGCTDWGHSWASGTHPTVDPFTWEFPSCNQEGCEDQYCSGLIYPSKADFDEGWPW